ncbi:zinc finger FYVE domain-containing protein 9 [Sitodiplosis mosellana]|uniref:zinc finger FYVE domain-containing protein 9 n=1 Tax=Sitodiplosis mosellana TaxID=263140 RepID=UPI0024448B1A|nr:zinc finger FYVE domain-containing protein 9 [Sitodiplosis mosellana]XP_055314950.1 zinc finger FYVE domain-containing protein 9 [Sitodiplosis mosellana]XP_055314951.1 zinc finger FYVE domain-containing protein 9 [Sitodiplosis mosellana]XP_055314952.1 zinc finger FYVE domain-containing protein 9 [Sitodiplosis mosellana]
MDIVDINKVLDDLELNEEQHSKLNKSSPAINESKQPDLYASYKYGQISSGPTAPSVSTTSSASAVPPPPIVNRITKTNFVKVSNVFNSLNEYVNAGIDTVKIPEENATSHHMTLNSKEAFVTPSNSSFVVSRKNELVENNSGEMTASNSRKFSTEVQPIDNTGLPTEEEVRPLTLPKANFWPAQVTISLTSNPEKSNHEQLIQDHSKADLFVPVRSDQFQPSNQLEQFVSTSSSDQFIPTSDLPSYEECQNVQDSSKIITGSTDFSKIHADSNETESSVHDDDENGDEEEEEENELTSSESDNSESDTGDEKTTDPACGERTVDSVEFRTELSSVVPPTSLSLEITASHETDTALPDVINGESSEILAKEFINQVENKDEGRAANVTKNANVAANQAIDAEKNTSNDRFIKPITFETAATMDDVSDTELESYLQELEDLEDNPMLVVRPKSDSMKSAIDSMKSEGIEPYVNDGNIYSVDHSIEHVGELNQIASRDDRNADSFSQASTVEFGEVNAISGNEQLPNVNTDQLESVQHIEPVMESIDSVVDAESTVEMSENQGDNQAEANPQNESTSELEDDGGEREISSDLEQHNECSECELDQQAAGVAKRPNSLNLQNCNTTLVDQQQSQQNPSNSATNFSNDENAGNTPAACGQFLSSSISSDDSNIANDNNQMIHQMENSQSNIDSESANESNASENYADQSMTAHPNAANISIHQIGKMAPYWVPDNMTVFCMQCNQKFSFIKRRHHCRACGLVLCSACCSLKAKLEYLGDVEARICVQCDILLNQNRDSNRNLGNRQMNEAASAEVDPSAGINSPYEDMPSPMARSPNPNNPMEYCSVIPPHQQVTSSAAAPISVMVPVGVLKREGVPPKSQRKEKNVMFSDGIRPGCDLTDLDNSWDSRPNNRNGVSSPSGSEPKQSSKSKTSTNLKLPSLDPKTNSYIPASTPTNGGIPDSKLPPICVSTRTEFKYAEVNNNEQLIERLQNQQLKFMIQRNFYVLVKIVKLTCCINKAVINFTTQGMHLVGQDEIVILLELDSSNQLPKDIFLHLNEIYRDADKGQAITELGFSMAGSTPFLGSKEHGGFLFIRTSFQCMQNIIIPENPYLIGILIHRWEVPWAKIFPLRLMLRLGALHRYYPSPHVSVRGRNSVYAEIAQTIINFLADFRTYSYTIPTIRGMYIHMCEDRRTNVLIPRNRYDQVMKALNNSSDHIFALAANFSELADGHLVCVQNTESGCAETHAYSTQAINIQGKPRKVTGASFLVLNGALKTTSGLSGKCSIVEDGLMVQILPKKMVAIQQALKTMKDIDIVCGPVNGDESQTELVCIQWVENDTNFNVGVISPIDKKPMDGIPSIRVHHGLDFANSNHIIRWTEVFILKSDDESAHGKDPIDMSKLSEQIARSASMALVSFLDLLSTNGMTKLAIRATLDQDQVCYEAGSNYDKLAPLYMNALDNELIPTLHRQATNLQLDQTISLELVFNIMDV